MLAPYFFSYQDAFEPWMSDMVTQYLRIAQEAGREPDQELLAPIQSRLDQASSQESAT